MSRSVLHSTGWAPRSRRTLPIFVSLECMGICCRCVECSQGLLASIAIAAQIGGMRKRGVYNSQTLKECVSQTIDLEMSQINQFGDDDCWLD